ncbi:MAG: FecR family protein [Planctomycetes bacterium]|jgi:ferric-dicitrate binding protein FerR (iron transport regulator)|nr:FecR family protein [Planctomycetota bacterium]
MSSDRSRITLSDLLLRQLSDGLSDEEQARLKAWLAEDAEARQYYVEFMALNAQLRKQRVTFADSTALDIDLTKDGPSDVLAVASRLEEADQDETPTSEPSPERVDEIRRIAEQRLETFLAEQEQIRRQQAIYQRYQAASPLTESLHNLAERIYTTATWTRRNAVRLATLASVVLVGLAVIHHALRHRVVATLNEVVHAQWDQPPAEPNLYPGPMFLRGGFARLTFQQGATVILQAPCAFDLSSKNRMVLHHGTITAQVPVQAHGFAIETPQSTVTDFGTEFGVQVQTSAAAEVHVFDGRVRLETASRPRQPSQKREVPQGKAAVITKSGELNIDSLGARPHLFARNIPQPNAFGIPNKRLDLADIVGGGSGFGTGSRYAGIDPVTGRKVSAYRSEKRTGEETYVEVPSLPFVDGVFVPRAQGGLMPISTAGHHFDFPPGGGDWYVEIAHGGQPDPQAFLTLDGQTYGTTDRPALLMHANVGITFNLDAIRESLAGSRIKRFTSVCGISNHVQKTKTPDAIIYVLVDGQVRFYRKIELPTDLAVNIRVDLRENERFLTLVCMAGTANYGDWTFFGVPALELEGER